ncbi:perilipin-3-like isoform X2 [Emydura macquarii macquarii]|uniref:perilipin-3-like isoform X2 n=1 Tax=Emydura macquarii macquarii TaxID=1129001 RepID=UPI00352A2056
MEAASNLTMPFTEKEMHITLQEQATVASQQTMSSDEEHLTCPETGEPKLVQNIKRTGANVPLSSTCERPSPEHTTTENQATNPTAHVEGKGLNVITTSTVSCMQPVGPSLDSAIAVAPVNMPACEGMREKLSADMVASDNQELVSSIQACAKATVCSGAKHVVGMAKEAVHNSIEIATSVNKLMESSVGQIVTSSIDAVLMKPEELMMVHYPPVTDEGLAKLAASLEGAEVASVEQQKQEQSDSVRVGSLPAEDHQHSLAKMDHAEQMAQEALSQLRQTIDLIKYVQQGIEKNYYGQATLSGSRGELKGNEADGAAQPEQMESHTLAMSCTTIQQLQSTCLSLLSIIHDFPTLIQDKIQKVHHSMEELHLCFSSAASFQDLSHEVLNQSQEKVNDAKKSLDELLQYEIQSIPLT